MTDIPATPTTPTASEASGTAPVTLLHGPGDEQLLVGVRHFDRPFLFSVALEQGAGSSDLWLDRGRIGKVRVAEFRRLAGRVLLVLRNKHFLAGGDPAAARAGAESFAQSVVWSAPVLREEADGVAVVDATGLVLGDHDRVAEHLAEREQGAYEVDEAASFPLADRSRTGPSGTRLAALVTFRGPGLGAALRTVAPDPRALSLVQHLRFTPLPEPALPARRYHPGSGGYGIGHEDHALVGTGNRQVKLQPRFRTAEPVVFQVDPAIPEPLRTAVVEGGNWWREAFAAAGLPDAYRVEVGGPGFDPYAPGVNSVVWVHRAGRGWSHGQGLTDPRTGEIVTGRVRLGSQRADQVRALGESLLAPYGRPDEAERLAAVEKLVLDRLRQLAAHEIGHALGFMHNYASTVHPKPSVMDYPAARVRVTGDGALDLSQAYATGLGPWDLFLVAHAYGEFPDREEDEALAELRSRARESGLVYVTDEDGHGPDAAHADGVPWVTAGGAFDALAEVLAVRDIALAGFSRGVLPPGRQTGELEERATLLHLLHRHEATAVARLVGGVRYAYGVAGEAGTGTVPVAAADQRRALERLAELLRAERLALPVSVLEALTPPAIRYERTAQYPDSRAGRVFDPFTAVAAAASLVAGQLLHPARLNRLAWQHAADPGIPGVTALLDALLTATWHRPDAVPAAVPAGGAVQRTSDWVVLRHLLAAVGDDATHPPVRAELRSALRDLAARIGSGDAQEREAAEQITAYLTDPASVRLDPLPRIPPGAPN
ncbi:zinc-dependent metalloprotease [Streptomyces sp. NPDC093109]|uniref:zinc-dependent metalloprotease n=1 Tax=Streptomyces sp. NPDC093109 TaxID=3154977 RepID=UPI00344B1EA5